MRIEIILFLITGAIIANVYTEGKFLKQAFSYKKYYQMAGIALGALFLYYVLKKNPLNARNILATSNDYIKYLPVDKNTSSILSPILDFTSKHDFSHGGGYQGGSHNSQYGQSNQYSQQEQRSTDRIAQSGKKSTKRSVSETKKKYVAARQNWKCEDCKNQLTAWFEVDHKIHGKKTTIENL
jgi:hypothetical protein